MSISDEPSFGKTLSTSINRQSILNPEVSQAKTQGNCSKKKIQKGKKNGK